MVRLSSRLRARRDEAGTVAVLVAILAVALFVAAALVVDLGLARDVKRQAQNAADAAALAAGNVLYGDGTTPRFADAVAAAKRYAADNYDVTETEWAACTDVAPLRYRPAGSPQCISFQNATSSALDVTRPDTVRVRIPTRGVDTGLGAAAGVEEIPVASAAESALHLGTKPKCILCVIGPVTHNLQNGDVTVSGGDAYFNGSLVQGPNGEVRNTTGTTSVQGTATGGTQVPSVITNQPAVPDPLAFLTMPSAVGLSQKTNPCTGGSGIYGSFSFPATCVLPAGLYVIAGGAGSAWSTSGSSVVTGTGVTLFFTCGTPSAPTPCAPGATGANLDMAGSSGLSLTAPTSGPYEGLAIVYDRNNNATHRVVGTGGASIQGTLYAPNATLQTNGNGCISTMEAMIVVKTVVMNGDPSCLKTAYDPAKNTRLPPTELHLSR